MHLKGDYWILDLRTGSLSQLGKPFPESSLMFAKFSPDDKSVAYVSQNNIYVEDLATSQIRALTTNGTATLFNGTFDYIYQQEFSCHDGFRWCSDSKSIAYWQVDAGNIKKFNLINNTDSIYSQVIPIEYPKAGQDPPACKVGVVTIDDARTTWMNIPGDPVQHYIIRMEFIPNTVNLLIQQLNRKQNHSKLIFADIATGNTHLLQEESDEAWVEIFQTGDTYSIDFTNTFTWLNETNSILWISEKDGWRHLYMIPLDGKPEKLITKGNYDLMALKYVDYEKGYVYFLASPGKCHSKIPLPHNT